MAEKKLVEILKGATFTPQGFHILDICQNLSAGSGSLPTGVIVAAKANLQRSEHSNRVALSYLLKMGPELSDSKQQFFQGDLRNIEVTALANEGKNIFVGYNNLNSHITGMSRLHYATLEDAGMRVPKLPTDSFTKRISLLPDDIAAVLLKKANAKNKSLVSINLKDGRLFDYFTGGLEVSDFCYDKPNSRVLVYGKKPGELKPGIWAIPINDPTNPNQVVEFEANDARITGMQAGKLGNDNFLVTASSKGELKLYDADFKLAASLEAKSQVSPHSIALDGKNGFYVSSLSGGLVHYLINLKQPK